MALKNWFFIFLLISFGVYFPLTSARTTQSAQLALLTGNSENDAYVFDAAGFASCHMIKGSKDRLSLADGHPFNTNFGVFYAPNVSMSVIHGIQDWTLLQFATAVRDGVSPEGEHYFPVFP